MSKKSFRVKEDGYYTSIMLFIYLILLYTVDKQTPRTNNLTRSKLRKYELTSQLLNGKRGTET